MGITTSPLNWKSSSFTHTGNVRKENEDACYVHPQEFLWIVADGMGGHASGQLASRMIVDYFQDFHATPLFGLNIKKLKYRLKAINKALLLAAENQDSDIIGSTVALLFAQNNYCVSIWAGDSRVYRYRNNKLITLTRDHSQLEELIEIGMNIDEIKHASNANVITRAIGAHQELKLECHIEEIKPDDIYLLCSDGLNKQLNDSEISEILASGPLEKSVQELLTRSLQNDASDNITAVGVTCISS